MIHVDDSHVCRICLEEDTLENLIYPCKCSGSNKYVHKDCLNEWRATSDNPNNFHRCEICMYKYVSDVIYEENTYDKLCRKMTNYNFIFYTINYGSILLINYLLKKIDTNLIIKSTIKTHKYTYLSVASLLVFLFQFLNITCWFLRTKNKILYCNLYTRNKSFIVWGICIILFSLFLNWILTIIITQIIFLKLYQTHFIVADNINKLERLEIKNYEPDMTIDSPILGEIQL